MTGCPAESRSEEGGFMAMKNVSGTLGRSGVTPAPTMGDHTVRVAAEKRTEYVWELSARERAIVEGLGT